MDRASHSSERQRLATEPQVAKFLERISRVVAETESKISSRTFTSQKITSISDAVKTLKRALGESASRLELESLVQEEGGLKSLLSSSDYLTAQDKVLGLCDGALALALAASELLPKKGTVLELGAGTGTQAAQLLQASPFRRVLAIDTDEAALSLAREKARALCGGELARFQARIANIRLGFHGLSGPFDGAIMNRVLFTLPVKDRDAVLRQVFKALKPGAIFILVDPLPVLASEAGWEKFLTRAVVDSVLNGTQLTELEIGLFAYLSGRTRQGLSKATSLTEQSESLLKSGFQIFQREAVFYETHGFIASRRPVLPSRK